MKKTQKIDVRNNLNFLDNKKYNKIDGINKIIFILWEYIAKHKDKNR